MRLKDEYTPIKSAAPIREWIADKIRPKDAPAATAPAVAATPEEKPAKKKFGSNMGAWSRAVTGGMTSGVDRDGQILRPSADQRGVAGWLSGISPRTKD